MWYALSVKTVDITLVPALGKVVIRDARSGERISFAISAVKGSLGLVVETLASGCSFETLVLDDISNRPRMTNISARDSLYPITGE